VVNDFIERLDAEGVPTTRSTLTTSVEVCLDEYEASLRVFYTTIFLRIDLYAFADELAATAVRNKIPPDADCTGGGPAWVAEIPYFQCGAVIAFLQTPDAGLSETFEELCGPPFARTFASGIFRDLG